MKRITEYENITSVSESDVLPIVDVSDTEQASTGSTKKGAIETIADYLKDRVETLTNKTLTSPAISGGTVDGATISGGTVASDTNVVEVLKKVYPVGCIYTSTVSTNPSTLFGFGTWSAFGAGKVMVGLDSSDTDFDTAEETGGQKTTGHAFPITALNANKSQDSGSNYWNSIIPDINNYLTSMGSSATTQGLAMRNVGGDIRTNGTTMTEITHYRYTAPNLQPYIVTYFWKRES